ncbi:AAA family ATPase [candidate division KSB1 bacterium]|nr:AAA family ATPase [candidate division KSB1 bacterium]
MITVAISGKGGTGKTTFAAAIIRWLSDNRSKSILAVDADANVNLNDLLGIRVRETIGSIREEMREKTSNLPGGMTKQQFLEYKIQSTLVETPDFDFVAMGRPEGPGCYCYANNLLRDILKTLGENYDYVVLDNEAGMEHLSRRTAQEIDYLLMLSDPTARGLHTAGNINRLLKELETRVKHRYLILNRVQSTIPNKLTTELANEGLQLLGSIPFDEMLMQLDQQGEAIWNCLPDSAVYAAVGDLMQRLGINL